MPPETIGRFGPTVDYSAEGRVSVYVTRHLHHTCHQTLKR
jgi:hypothetical protein